MNETDFSRGSKYHLVGGIAAISIAIILLIGIINIVVFTGQPRATIPDNFLISIFKLHAGLNGVQENVLDVFSFLDVLIIILVGVMSFALYPMLKQVYKIGAIIAISMPIIGLLLYILTHEIGRTGIIPAGLTIAIIMMFDDNFRKRTAYIGVLANSLLLIGDIGAISYATIFAISISMGYILFTIWCFLIAWRLFQLVSQNQE